MNSPLNRQRFVEAALSVIAQVGVDKLSMRRVARELGVSPMAMYKHFANKEELVAAAFEEFIAQAKVIPEKDAPWDIWLEGLAKNMYCALSSEISWVPLLGALPLGGNAIAVNEAVVAKLAEAGFSTDMAVRGYLAVIQVVVGAVCMRASLGQELRQLSKAGVSKTPPAHRLEPVFKKVAANEPLMQGLPLLIRGMHQQLIEKGHV